MERTVIRNFLRHVLVLGMTPFRHRKGVNTSWLLAIAVILLSAGCASAPSPQTDSAAASDPNLSSMFIDYWGADPEYYDCYNVNIYISDPATIAELSSGGSRFEDADIVLLSLIQPTNSPEPEPGTYLMDFTAPLGPGGIYGAFFYRDASGELYEPVDKATLALDTDTNSIGLRAAKLIDAARVEVSRDGDTYRLSWRLTTTEGETYNGSFTGVPETIIR